MFLGGALFGTAFMTAGAGVTMHSLPLLYLGNCEYNNFLICETMIQMKLPTYVFKLGTFFTSCLTNNQLLLEWDMVAPTRPLFKL